jgi:hypothetical protein
MRGYDRRLKALHMIVPVCFRSLNPVGEVMKKSTLLFRQRKGNVIASAIAGGVILLFLAVVVFVMPEPTDFQRGVLRFFIATGGAMLATFFLGGVVLEGSLAERSTGSTLAPWCLYRPP